MAYKMSKWELSEIPDEEIQAPKQTFTDGIHAVKVLEARYDDEYTAERPELADTYSITVEAVEGGARTTLRYWVKNKERTMYSSQVVGTLNSLGKAVFGSAFTDKIPVPMDIIGAVVDAEMKTIKTADGKSYLRCYHFQPTAAENVLYSDIEQYFRQ